MKDYVNNTTGRDTMSLRTHNRLFIISTSALACIASLSSAAYAETGAEFSEETPGIVVRDDIRLDTPPPTGALDNLVNLTGVGQVVIRPNQATTGLGVCTGTLINPRTVIFAAHCVNSQAATSYGFASGGTAISVGFSANNLPGVRRWLGLDGGTRNATDLGTNIFNVEQVWYDERSIPAGFLEADIALATLDTHADGIPTWTMLFSPLTEETHGIINGYGGRGLGPNGANLGIDFRRRIAENMISSLSSLDDSDTFLFGESGGLPQSLYLTDFDSRVGQAGYNPVTGSPTRSYDFDLYDGAALPNEGTTAGGDSGGPLIADQAFAKPVVVGVLSGGSRFFGPQPFSSYGTTSFYQPLFMFWDQIVANNSYAYVSALAGDKNWNNPNHWVQTMDPNYAIALNSRLTNALPGFVAPGISDQTPKFGNICFLDFCEDLSQLSVPLANGAPNSIFIPGGPGTTRFVPNNIVANPAAGIRARYYEVTLNAAGSTRLADPITIDRLNLTGQAALDIKPDGSLKVWGDYTQTGGWLNVDGELKTGEAFLGQGLLTGHGRFDPTYLTSVAGMIAPGSVGNTGVLTIAGDVILSSASSIYFDVGRKGSDRLAIVADANNIGAISLGGTASIVNATGNNSARFGQTFNIVSAQGGVLNRFDKVLGSVGVLYPELEYLSNSVVARMRAVKFGDFFIANGINNPFSIAFGNALDGLRPSSYSQLADIYALIDIQGANQLNQTFQSLSASVAGRATILDEKQTGRMRTLVSDRLSQLGTSQARGGTLRILGDANVLVQASGLTQTAASQVSFSQNYQSSTSNVLKLPENVSGFMAASYTRSSLADTPNDRANNEGSLQVVSGLEIALNNRTTIATAIGFADGEQNFGGGRANVKTSQAAAYGSYLLGGGFYVGGQASFSRSDIATSNLASGNRSIGSNETSATTIIGEFEFGRNFQIDGIHLTPRASIAHSSYNVSGFGTSGGLPIMVDGITRKGIDAKFGLKINGSTKISRASSWSLQPEVKMDYVKRLTGNYTNLQLQFLGSEAIGINLPIALQDANYGEIKGGIKLTNGIFELGAAVESRIGGQLYRDDRAALNMAVRF